jgi:hypothetical protein
MKGSGNTINLLPLIRPNDAASGLAFEFTTSSDADEERLELLMDIKTNRKWRNYAESFVVGVSYRTGGLYGLKLKVKGPAKDHWMP